MRPMSQITEKTRITLGMVVTLLGFSAWLTQIYFQGTANADSIREIKDRQSKIETIQTDVAVIKSQMQTIQESLDELRGHGIARRE